MQADAQVLTQLLSMGALIGATIEYAEILKRRGRRRLQAAWQQESAETGLHGLVRVFLADGAPGSESES